MRFCKSNNGTGKSASPVLILANKQDLPAALDIGKIEQLLGLKDLGAGGVCWHLQPTCAITGDGLEDGMKILHEMIVRRRKTGGKNGNGNSALDQKKKNPTGKKLQRSHSHVY